MFRVNAQEAALFAVSLAFIGRFFYVNYYCVTTCSAYFSKEIKDLFFLWVLLFFLITLNKFLLVNFSSIHFTVMHSLADTLLY